MTGRRPLLLKCSCGWGRMCVNLGRQGGRGFQALGELDVKPTVRIEAPGAATRMAPPLAGPT